MAREDLASSPFQNQPGVGLWSDLGAVLGKKRVLCEAIGSSEAKGVIVLAVLRPSLKPSPRFGLDVLSVTRS